MELLLIVPLLMLMGGGAVYFALSERRQPLTAPATWMPVSRAAGTSTHSLDSEDGAYDDPVTINPSDVLLADALTEMLEIKDEITGLRDQVRQLDQELHDMAAARARRARSQAGAKATPRRTTVVRAS